MTGRSRTKAAVPVHLAISRSTAVYLLQDVAVFLVRRSVQIVLCLCLRVRCVATEDRQADRMNCDEVAVEFTTEDSAVAREEKLIDKLSVAYNEEPKSTGTKSNKTWEMAGQPTSRVRVLFTCRLLSARLTEVSPEEKVLGSVLL